MKTAILKLLLLAIPLVSFMAQAETADQPVNHEANQQVDQQVDQQVNEPVKARPVKAKTKRAAKRSKAPTNFDTGEAEVTGVGAKLQSTQMLKDDVAIPGSARGAALVTVSEQNPAAASASSSSSDSSLGPTATSTAPAAPAAAPMAATPLGLDTQAQWRLQNGERISDVFTRWSRVIGWQIAWEPTDMVALADLELADSYSGAITKVVDALNRGGADIQVKFYASNHMLRIMARK